MNLTTCRVADALITTCYPSGVSQVSKGARQPLCVGVGVPSCWHLSERVQRRVPRYHDPLVTPSLK